MASPLLGLTINKKFNLPYILTYRSQLFSHIFRPKTRVRPLRWSYLSENFHQVGTKAKLIGYCVHALVHAHTKTTNSTRSCTSNFCLRNYVCIYFCHFSNRVRGLNVLVICTKKLGKGPFKSQNFQCDLSASQPQIQLF